MESPQVLGRVRIGMRIRGTVQGVGFRPTLHRIAASLGLAGVVRNDEDGVWVEVEGPRDQVEAFGVELRRSPPPLARIDTVEVERLAPRGDRSFAIALTPEATTSSTRIPADAAPCDDCLRELFDPADRRHRYPFINCTACGPRYTIVAGLPYDRHRTTMARFNMCRRCRREYEDPSDRRFHAEPNACPSCGPQLALVASGERRRGDAALSAAVARIARGEIVAVRGVGGFLLAVDARNPQALARLRSKKRRPHKPFALMARDLAEAERVAVVDAAAARVLSGPARPIVLLRAREDLPGVAPGLGELGLMLPSTPLHHLLLAGGPSLMVMTSGNFTDEPLARDNDEAEERLAFADAYLEHDRPIHTRIDDSVVRIVAGGPQPVRRARGLVPEPIALPCEGSSVLAVGAELKSTLCLTRGNEAFLSQHLGDLSHPSTLALFEETVAKLSRLYDVAPSSIAHDLHPDYRSTDWATRWSLAQKKPRIAVQHHHAHIASCLAEHGRTGPVLGVAFDGTGCGPAGQLWGGEFLVADLAGFRRVGHLRALKLAGGEAAIREPWRLAAAALVDVGAPLSLLSRCDARRLAAVGRLLCEDKLAPPATSAGRWFDAFAALLAVRDEISYEGQAAIELEALAGDSAADPLPFEITNDDPFVVDLRPATRALLDLGRTRAELAAAVHETFAAIVVAACKKIGMTTVALSGGCFQNARLTTRCVAALGDSGFEVLVHRRVPPNDGGISLGQAAVALRRQEDANVSRHSR